MLIPTPKDIRNTIERIKNIPAFIPKSAKNGTEMSGITKSNNRDETN
jgi:hypothetical protein